MELISVKIPKTGSESFGHVLTQVYGQDELVKFIQRMKFNPTIHDPSSWFYTDPNPADPFQEELKQFKPYDDQMYVHNHVPVDMFDGYYDNAPRIAFMREPVSWIISSYWFTKMLNHIPKGMGIWGYIELDYRRNWVSMLMGGSIDKFDWIGFQETWFDDVKTFLNRFTSYDESFFWGKTIPTRNVQTDDAYIRFRDGMLKDKAFIRRFKSLHKEDIRLYKEARNEFATKQ